MSPSAINFALMELTQCTSSGLGTWEEEGRTKLIHSPVRFCKIASLFPHVSFLFLISSTVKVSSPKSLLHRGLCLPPPENIKMNMWLKDVSCYITVSDRTFTKQNFGEAVITSYYLSILVWFTYWRVGVTASLSLLVRKPFQMRPSFSLLCFFLSH